MLLTQFSLLTISSRIKKATFVKRKSNQLTTESERKLEPKSHKTHLSERRIGSAGEDANPGGTPAGDSRIHGHETRESVVLDHRNARLPIIKIQWRHKLAHLHHKPNHQNQNKNKKTPTFHIWLRQVGRKAISSSSKPTTRYPHKERHAATKKRPFLSTSTEQRKQDEVAIGIHTETVKAVERRRG